MTNTPMILITNARIAVVVLTNRFNGMRYARSVDQKTSAVEDFMDRSNNPEETLETSANQLIAQLHEYESVLRFYARHEHWMGHIEDDDLNRVLIAMTGSAREQHGYSYAERVLEKYRKLKP